ncbi:hypothetical protein LTR09_012856 [Extremus antarcticus]|uniref:Heterokaryon incompatibility domain-containing protein n=1 Tax=Extremus antarcticus TaxID=702011 RepID=A0AAJ0D9C5_9PEZI|nr:hypothetical protein LTR09_012856 [Extremus antarcticus]
MFGISRDGGIPGLRYETTQDGQPSLAYVRASPGAHYVAISHLWADGLGNPHDNTLPRCQLQSIADQVKACNEILAKNPPISTDHPMNLLAVLRSKAEKLFAKFEDHPTDFWLDVYCVPLLPPGDTDDELYLDDRPGRDPGFTREVIQRLKSIALQRMYETYAWARCTLVLDRELMSIPRPSTLSERWARIALCAWNTRFWTFQEYCLAPQTFFQFEDGPWLKEFLVPWQYEGQVASNFDVLNNAWAMNLWRMSKPERTYMGAKRDGDSVGGNDTGAEPMTSSAEIFTSVWNCLNLRSTTKAEDVAMICANLMYLNATELSSLGPKDLMKAIVAAQEVLPLHILSFDANRHDPRAADVVPFGRYDGWVPVSPVQSQKLEQGPVYLKVLDSGLELRRTGNAMIEGQIFEVESPESHAWSFDDNAATVWVRPPLSFQIPAGQKVLVVFQRNIGELPQNSRRQRRGFCLLKGVEMGGHLHASYLCPVNWGVRGHNTIHEPQQLRHCAAKRVAVHSGHIIIDCDIEGWRQGSRSRRSILKRRTNIVHLMYILPIITGIGWLVLMLCLVNTVWKAWKSIDGVAVFVLGGFFLSVALVIPGIMCLPHLGTEIHNYVYLTQGISDTGRLLPWSECVELSLPRSSRGFSTLRYWVLRPTLWALLSVHKSWLRLRHLEDNRRIQLRDNGVELGDPSQRRLRRTEEGSSTGVVIFARNMLAGIA